MKITSAVVLILALSMTTGCSREALKRTGYETLQSYHQHQCRKDLSSECNERERYESYQRERQQLGGERE